MMILSRQSRALVIDAIREASRFVEEHKGKIAAGQKSRNGSFTRALSPELQCFSITRSL